MWFLQKKIYIKHEWKIKPFKFEIQPFFGPFYVKKNALVT
jgi:hypothetical protein